MDNKKTNKTLLQLAKEAPSKKLAHEMSEEVLDVYLAYVLGDITARQAGVALKAPPGVVASKVSTALHFGLQKGLIEIKRLPRKS